jgi:selenium metabolism protein YedF
MLDCRNMACPQPVLAAKDLIEAEGPQTVEVLVDNQAASQNVSRFMSTRGYQAEVASQGADFLITGRLSGEAPVTAPPNEPAPETYACAVPGKGTCLMVGTDRIGHGDDQLGGALMKNFLATLKEMGSDLWRLIFVNNGVRLCVEGSPHLPVLQELEKSGVSILVCGTCLDFFNLLEFKQVGETTNMLDVVTSLQVASKVITI